MGQQARALDCSRPESFVSYKQSSLLYAFLGYEENEVMTGPRPQGQGLDKTSLV
jgi:hypothetical protein